MSLRLVLAMSGSSSSFDAKRRRLDIGSRVSMLIPRDCCACQTSLAAFAFLQRSPWAARVMAILLLPGICVDGMPCAACVTLVLPCDLEGAVAVFVASQQQINCYHSSLHKYYEPSISALPDSALSSSLFFCHYQLKAPIRSSNEDRCTLFQKAVGT